MPMNRRSEPFSNGTATIEMQAQTALTWHEIVLSFQKADGTAYGVLSAGTATVEIQGAYSDAWEAAANPIDLTSQRRWAPFLSGIKAVRITVSGAPADAYCVAAVTSA